jgi:hypothetical protein
LDSVVPLARDRARKRAVSFSGMRTLIRFDDMSDIISLMSDILPVEWEYARNL